MTGHISKLETVYKVLVEDINSIIWPTVLFNHSNKLKITELSNTNTVPTKNHKDSGAMPPLVTQPYSPHLSLIDTLVSPVDPLPFPCVESWYAKFLVRTGDLPNVLLLGVKDMLFGVYQYYLHQNPVNYLHGRIAEDGKWQARWKKCMYVNPSLWRTVRKFWENICRNLLSGARWCTRSKLELWEGDRFQLVILQRKKGIINAKHICAHIYCFKLTGRILGCLKKSGKTHLMRLWDSRGNIAVSEARRNVIALIWTWY